MSRWAVFTLGAFIVLGAIGVAAARFFGKSGSRLSIQVSVVSHWLAAYILWSFVAALAEKYRLIAHYEPGWYVLVAVIGGWLHYRARINGRLDHGRTVFVGAQLVWLLVILYLNGVLNP